MMPPAPTTVHVLASVQETPVSQSVVPLFWGVQVAPPSVVCRMVPLSPAVVHVLASVHETRPRRSRPTNWFVQLAPPSVVWTIFEKQPDGMVQTPPTTVPVSASVNETPVKATV